MQNPPPRHSPIRLDACNLVSGLGLIGDKWSLLLLRSALYGVRRFDDFKAELDIPRTILSDRLKKLVLAGIMVRQTYQVSGNRPRLEYILTGMGEDLRLPLLAMTQWADAWLGGVEPKPLRLVDRATGTSVRIGLVNSEGSEIAHHDVKYLLADWARAG
jgi:DNA-binding HxlR family transcriptional regulator